MNVRILTRRAGAMPALQVLLLFLIAASLTPTSASAYMALLRQGVESADTPNAFDHYGDRVATGDFNGDGYEDVAVSAPDESNDVGGGDHGVVIVNYGGPRGITHTGTSLLTPGAPGDFSLRFGKGLAAGDFDGDGVHDLAVGLPGADILGDDDAGAVWVYRGILDAGISLAPYAQLHQDDCGAAVEPGDQFGYTLTAGDMNLDGYDDLFVGSIGENAGAGLVGFFRGSNSGVTTTGSGFATQLGLGGANEPGSLFGLSLTLGDFLDDDHLELAIGAPYADDGQRTDAGKVYIVRGTSIGPVGTGGAIVTAANLGVTAQPNSAFGWSLTAGRYFDANDRWDLAIGEPMFSLPQAVTSGRVVVVDYTNDGGVALAPIVLDQGAIGEQVEAGAAFGWALATGNIMDTLGIAGPDDYQDLAISAPNDDVPIPTTEGLQWGNAGSVYVVPGISNGFVESKTKVMDAMERNDLWFAFDERMGWSLAFGKFDDTGWDNLAIGVPEKKYPAFISGASEHAEAGQVYIVAPWRQPSGRPHRSSMVYDCENRIQYAQRFGQRLTPASTTKALTALIAAEAIQSGEVNPDDMYVVPGWVANSVTGGQYGLFPGEQISFIDLVRTMIAVSGNDCAYAVGNILTGNDNVWDNTESTDWNLEHVLTDFNSRMKERATQIGLSGASQFSNPAGRPVGDHWTTAVDMVKFIDFAMENELFRDIVGTTTWFGVLRLIPQPFVFPWLPPLPILIPVFDDVSNGYYSGVLSRDARATGVKGGSNGVSQKTGLFSAAVDNGYAKVSVFGVPSYGALSDLGAELMSLVGTDCRPAPIDPDLKPDLPYANATRVDVPVPADEAVATTVNLDPDDPQDVCVEVMRHQQATETACLTALTSRTVELDLAPGEAREFGAHGNNFKQIGLGLHNPLATPIQLSVLLLTNGYQEVVNLAPGESWRLPAQPPLPAGVPGWDFVVQNISSIEPASLVIEESYVADLLLGVGPPLPSDWKMTVLRDGPFRSDLIRLTLIGCDDAMGNTFDVSIHSELVGTPVIDEGAPLPVATGAILGLENYPNPFNPRTTVSFELGHDATVSLEVFDLSGRLVRVLESGRAMAAGQHSVAWDGTDGSGRTVASGVYIARVEDGRTAQTRRMTLMK